jgi:hypothetical protein
VCFRLNRLLFLGVLLAAAPLHAVQRLSLDVGDLQGEGVRVQGLQLALDLSPGAPVLVLSAERVSVGGQVIAPLRVRCPAFTWDSAHIRCQGGRLQAGHPWLGRPEAVVDLTWRHAGQRLQLQVRDLPLAGGRVQLALNAEFGAEGLSTIRWNSQWREVDFADDAAGWFGEGLGGTAQGAWRRGGHTALSLSLERGELLTPYFYLAPGDHPAALRAELTWNAPDRALLLHRFSYAHPGHLNLEGRAQVAMEPFRLQSLELLTGDTPAETLYRSYFQPLLGATLLESVTWQGGFRLSAAQGPGESLRATVAFQELGLEDAPDPVLHPQRSPRFALRGLNGQLVWKSGANGGGEVRPSRLSWQGGHLLGSLEIGPASLQAVLEGERFRLLEDVEIPLLDGSLWVDRLEVAAVPGGRPELDFDAVLTPVTLARLTRAFGWPEFSGSLSGVLPGLSLRQDGLKVDGKLLVRAFDGDMVIENLRLNGLFSSWPELLADVKLTGLDLERLTGTFSFGKITGRLDGQIAGLRLEDWQPVAFDARFATPPGDDSRHVISQRAVDNISNLGGAGISGSLSRTFLGVFEAFGYERLGIGCRLEDGVCRMSGVAPAEQGYHLVIGRGIPQINIRGYNSETDWNRLVGQLRQINAGGVPVVE